MYQVGQRVVYGIHGVCDIIEIEIKVVDRKKIPYFVLEPVEQPGARYYVPSENAAALAQAIRQIASSQQLRQRCGENARRYYRDNFRKEYFFETLEQVLQENCV